MATELSISQGNWSALRLPASQIRRDVFIKEQHVPEDMEWDDDDKSSEHWLAELDSKPVATLRITNNHQIGRVAVIAAHRNKGIGQALVQAAMAAHPKRDFWIHAQLQALPFWQKLGFLVEGTPFEEAGIAHTRMQLARLL